jgi:xylan 1,4-beta-xylosidase
LKVHRTGYLKNDPLSAYIDMGLPSDVSAVQLNALKSATSDQAEQDRMLRVGSDGLLDLDLAMRSNDVVLVTLEPLER